MAGHDLWAQLRAQYAGSTLLQYTLPLISAILLLYVAMAVFDRVEPLRQEHQQLQQQQARLAVLEAGADWAGLVAHEREREQALLARIWQARSVELGTADVQTAINALTRDRVQALRVRFAEPLWLPEANAWQLSAEFSGRLAASEVQALLAALDAQRPALRVERFGYKPGRSDLLTVQLSALLAAPAPANGGGARS